MLPTLSEDNIFAYLLHACIYDNTILAIYNIYMYLYIHVALWGHPVYYLTVNTIGCPVHPADGYLFTYMHYRCMMATNII